MPALSENELVHVVTRRVFPEEPKRHFAGRVIAVDDRLARIEGYAFVFHSGRNEFQKRPELRTRVLSLTDAGNTINVLPDTVELDSLHYAVQKGNLAFIDGKGFSLDVNEYGPRS